MKVQELKRIFVCIPKIQTDHKKIYIDYIKEKNLDEYISVSFLNISRLKPEII